MTLRLFIGYARYVDEPFAPLLYAVPTDAGLDVWIDRAPSMPSRNLTFHQEIRDSCNGRKHPMNTTRE